MPAPYAAYDRQSASSFGTGGRSMLDTPPPSPPPLIKPSQSLPGDDTMSLLGAPNVNGEGVGMSANTPTGRALGGVMKMMDGVNDIESVVPGAIPPPIIMVIQTLMTQIPEIVRNMQQMTGPGGMLSSMGANDLGMGAMGGGAPMNPMAGPMAGAPMGGGGMPMPMGEGRGSGMF